MKTRICRLLMAQFVAAAFLFFMVVGHDDNSSMKINNEYLAGSLVLAEAIFIVLAA